MNQDQPVITTGMGRLGYFVWTTAISVGMFAAMTLVPPVMALILAAILLALINASRLANIGMSRAWAWLSFVPIVNWFLWVRCQIFPEGYAQTRTLDRSARVLIGIVFVAFVLVFGLIILAAILRA